MQKASTAAAALALALFILGVATGAAAQPAAPPKADPKAPAKADPKAGKVAVPVPLSAAERDFMLEAFSDGRSEVELGKMSLQRVGHLQVKEFAARMVAERGKSNEELRALAARKHLTLSMAPSKEHMAHAAKLQKLHGLDFQHAYMNEVVAGHKRAIDLFKRSALAARDPEVKAFASRTVPTLEAHLQLAQFAQIALTGKKPPVPTKGPAPVPPKDPPKGK